VSDKEKVLWLRALLVIWGGSFVPLVLLVVGVPGSVESAQIVAGGILATCGVATVVYLLILSWRAAYLSGRAKR